MYSVCPITEILCKHFGVSLQHQRLSLYVPAWQERRISYKGLWSDGVARATILSDLTQYVEEGARIDLQTAETTIAGANVLVGENITRLWRTLNMLDAVYMGWPNKEAQTRGQMEFLDYKSNLATQYHTAMDDLCRLRTTTALRWSWKYVKSEEAQRLWHDVDSRAQRDVTLDLVGRFKTAMRRVKKPPQGKDVFCKVFCDRPELFWFIEIIVPTSAYQIAYASLKRMSLLPTTNTKE